MVSREEALALFESDDLIEIGMQADEVRRKHHPGGVASYIIDRNINSTNFCKEYCSFCAFYRPMGHKKWYVLRRAGIFDRFQERIDLGGPGMLFQGGLQPDRKIGWYQDVLRAVKGKFNM